MKQILIIAFSFIAFSSFASDTNPVIETKTIDASTSVINWVGKKVTGEHSGTINIKAGNLDFDGGTLNGGTIVMDMNSIKCTDLGDRGAGKLEGHLKSDDFFGVPNHPTATFKITEVKPSSAKGMLTITGDMTIKGITHPLTFDANVSSNGATADIIIDRTKYDIKYGSGSFFDGLGDKAIYDDFELSLNLKY